MLENHTELPCWQVHRSGMAGSLVRMPRHRNSCSEQRQCLGISRGSHVDPCWTWGQLCVVLHPFPKVSVKRLHHTHHSHALGALTLLSALSPAPGPGMETPGPEQKENSPSESHEGEKHLSPCGRQVTQAQECPGFHPQGNPELHVGGLFPRMQQAPEAPGRKSPSDVVTLPN